MKEDENNLNGNWKKLNFPTHRAYLLIIVSLVFALSSNIVFAQSASFTNDPTLYFTGTSSDPSTLYQDAISGNLDVGIQVCGVGQRYVGATYALQVGSTWNYALISYSSSTNALAFTSNDDGAGCYSVTPGFLTVSPSTLTTPDPDVFKAALPGNLYVAYEASANPGSLSNFIYAGTSASLLGSYTASRSFDQGTRQITVQTPQISFQTSSGSFSKSASDANYGISSDRKMVIGICDNPQGANCDSGALLTSSTFPNSYDSGLSSGQVNDQNTYTKYVVINGLGYPMCIGANLKVTSLSLAPNPIYYSQTLNISYTIADVRDSPYEIKGGNVDVTTNFNVKVSIYNSSNPAQIIYSTTIPVNLNIPAGTSLSNLISWPAYAHSGMYTVKVEADEGNDVTECSEGDNTLTSTFELKPITIPKIYIDGQQTDTFEYPNVPYNLSFHIENSDNVTLSNSTVTITEYNGLSLMAPMQIYNISYDGGPANVKEGLKTQSKVSFKTDYNGDADFAFIPTYNKLYLPQYNYTDLSDYVGEYSLSFSGIQEDGEEFKFVISGQLLSDYPFSIQNKSYSGPYSYKGVLHKTLVSQSMDFVYQTFVNFLDSIIN